MTAALDIAREREADLDAAIPAGLGLRGADYIRDLEAALEDSRLQATKDKALSLYDCDADSVYLCVLRAASAGLRLGRECHLIRRGGVCTYQIGVWGWTRLLHRTGLYATVDSGVIREGDTYDWHETPEGRTVFAHRRASLTARGPFAPAIAYWARVVALTGHVQAEVMAWTEVDAIRARQPFAGTPWRDYFDEMGRKCPLKRLAKRLSAEMDDDGDDDSQAVAQDAPPPVAEARRAKREAAVTTPGPEPAAEPDRPRPQQAPAHRPRGAVEDLAARTHHAAGAALKNPATKDAAVQALRSAGARAPLQIEALRAWPATRLQALYDAVAGLVPAGGAE